MLKAEVASFLQNSYRAWYLYLMAMLDFVDSTSKASPQSSLLRRNKVVQAQSGKDHSLNCRPIAKPVKCNIGAVAIKIHSSGFLIVPGSLMALIGIEVSEESCIEVSILNEVQQPEQQQEGGTEHRGHPTRGKFDCQGGGTKEHQDGFVDIKNLIKCKPPWNRI